MANESDQKFFWGFALFVVFAAASGVLIYLLKEETWAGFFPVCFAIGSCLGGIVGLIVYASNTYDQDDILKAAGLGLGTWFLFTLLLPIAVIVLVIVVIIWLISQSDSGSTTKKHIGHGEFDVYE